jgi:hypothetical protein
MAKIETGPVNVLGWDTAGVLIVSMGPPPAHPLHIVRADPQAFVADSLLDIIREGKGHPDVSFGDNILTIRGVNRTVSYGLRKHDPYLRQWLAVKAPEVDLSEE